MEQEREEKVSRQKTRQMKGSTHMLGSRDSEGEVRSQQKGHGGSTHMLMRRDQEKERGHQAVNIICKESTHMLVRSDRARKVSRCGMGCTSGNTHNLMRARGRSQQAEK